jgi:hypothetical protein
METSNLSPDPALPSIVELRRRLTAGTRSYELIASATGDDRVSVHLVGRDPDGEVVTEVVGEIPPEDLGAVAEITAGALAALARACDTPTARRTSAVARKRLTYPNANARWTAAEEARLTQLHRDGTTVEDLMREFGRNRGGIMARLVKLGLVSPGDWPPALADAPAVAA